MLKVYNILIFLYGISLQISQGWKEAIEMYEEAI